MFCPLTKIFRDRAIVIQNLKCNYILGLVLHRTYRFGMGYTTAAKHYLTINGEMITVAILQITDSPILKTKGKITVPLMSVSVIVIKTPTLLDTNNVYELKL